MYKRGIIVTMDERRLTVIEQTETDSPRVEEKTEKPAKVERQTNPIAQKLLKFHHEKIGKFSVKDLLRK